MLSDLFTDFDKMAVKYGVFKLYTIGDCYVVISLLNAEQRNIPKEAKNVVSFAFSLIDVIKRVKKKRNIDIDMRIGIHTVLIYKIKNILFLFYNYFYFYK